MIDKLPIEELEKLEAEYKRLQQNGGPLLKRQDAHEALLDFIAGHFPQFISAARDCDSLAAQLATIRAETVKECAKVMCWNCRHGHSVDEQGYHHVSSSPDIPAGEIRCAAASIRSLQHAEPQK